MWCQDGYDALPSSAMSHEKAAPAGALDGVAVLEVGVFIAAPFATLQLADLGADVIKVENLDGEPVRASGPFIGGESSTSCA